MSHCIKIFVRKHDQWQYQQGWEGWYEGSHGGPDTGFNICAGSTVLDTLLHLDSADEQVWLPLQLQT